MLSLGSDLKYNCLKMLVEPKNVEQKSLDSSTLLSQRWEEPKAIKSIGIKIKIISCCAVFVAICGLKYFFFTFRLQGDEVVGAPREILMAESEVKSRHSALPDSSENLEKSPPVLKSNRISSRISKEMRSIFAP